MRSYTKAGILLICYALLLLQCVHAADDDSARKIPNAAKVEFSQSSIDAPLLDITWCGLGNSQTILILTDKGTVYRTTDEGQKWDKLKDDFHKTAKSTIKDEEQVHFFDL